MYASRRLYVKQWEYQRPNERYKVQIELAGKPVKGIRESGISYVEEEVMCWHKANHIHAWFVDNVQRGQDDCKPYYVDEDQLEELLNVCHEVIGASKLVEGSVVARIVWNPMRETWAEQREPGRVIENPAVAYDLLPRMEGLFFGGYEYDESYLHDVIRTQEWAERMVADTQSGVPGDIYYQSSW